MQEQKLRLLFVDGHTLFREALCQLLVSEQCFELVACLEYGSQALEIARAQQLDVALVAESLPDTSGLDLCRELVTSFPKVSVVLLGECDHLSDPIAAVRAGATGFLLKCSHAADICDAIKLICRGQAVVDLRLMSHAIDHLVRPAPTQSAQAEGLHTRQMEILKLAARGKTNKEIANELGISQRTVQSHFFNLFNRLKVGSRTEAVFHAVKTGLISMSDLA
ncbi:LuxR C-terminal-related transcriptional regulator [Chloroflexota bacterium]